MDQIRGVTYAKVNLTLDILGKRPDGYHDLRSIMQSVSLGDEISVSKSGGLPGVHLKVGGEFAGDVPAGSSNLVIQAARLVLEEAGIDPGSACVEIDLGKYIPTQAGLGGGSSDAATTLVYTNVLFGRKLSPATLHRLAADLGSDVPFFLTGGTCLVEGRGERVTRIEKQIRDFPIIICKPSGAAVSTAVAYADLDSARAKEGNRHSGNATELWLKAFEAGQADLPLSNDFEPVILRQNPKIAHAYSVMREAGQAYGGKPLLCGSGASLMLPIPSQAASLEILPRLRAGIDGWISAAHTTNTSWMIYAPG